MSPCIPPGMERVPDKSCGEKSEYISCEIHFFSPKIVPFTT
jgi:hypothetical protein